MLYTKLTLLNKKFYSVALGVWQWISYLFPNIYGEYDKINSVAILMSLVQVTDNCDYNSVLFISLYHLPVTLLYLQGASFIVRHIDLLWASIVLQSDKRGCNVTHIEVNALKSIKFALQVSNRFWNATFNLSFFLQTCPCEDM